jgi:hypothetical protein
MCCLTEKCNKCSLIKDISSFKKDVRFKNGIQKVCKTCINIYQKKIKRQKGTPDKNKNAPIFIDGIKYKPCSKCGFIKDIRLFGVHKKQKYGVSPSCKDCDKEMNRIRDYRYVKNNPDKCRLIKNKCARKRNKKSVETIDDRYVDNALRKRGFKKEHITKELMEIQRLIIKTNRLCKTLQN